MKAQLILLFLLASLISTKGLANNKEPKPSIDDILEKIQEMGIDSLTNFEKQILDEYAKD